MNQLEKFQLLVKSLTLYSRHTLEGIVEDTDLNVEDLYIDPLPAGGIVKQVLGSKFMLLLGRKGTGKSILFDLCQRNLNRTSSSVGIYVNCLSVYQEHTYDVSAHLERIGISLGGQLSEEHIAEYLYRRGLIQGLITDLISQIKVRASQTWAEKIKEKLGLTKYHEIIGKLSELSEQTKNPSEKEISLIKSVLIKTGAENTNSEKEALSGKIGAGASSAKGPNISASAGASAESKTEKKTTSFREYSSVLLQVFRPRDTVREIFQILASLGITKLHLFLDDFSELNEEYQGLISNSLLSQIHQWNELDINVVIAGYPQRSYLGSEIDSSKIDILHLDFDQIYRHLDLPGKHTAAMSFVDNLLEKRLSKITGLKFDDYFSGSKDDVLKTIFQASFNSPRMIGKVLQIAERTHLRAGSKISSSSIRSAAKEFYEDRRNYFEKTNQYSTRESDLPFRSPLEAISQMELLDKIVEKQKENQTHIGTTKYSKLGKFPPVSHFHISREYEQYIDFLQVNYFINKVAEMSVKTEKDIASIYALNFGLCESNRIAYWEPLEREYRDYLKERFFHFDDLLNDFLSKTKKIICTNCKHIFPFSDYEALAKFKMNCSECGGIRSCAVAEELIDKSKVLKDIGPKLLPEIEIKILDAIKSLEQNSLPTFPKDIAGEVDCSYQLVSKRMEKLKELPFQLVVFEKAKDSKSGIQRTIYKLTAKASGTYF